MGKMVCELFKGEKKLYVLAGAGFNNCKTKFTGQCKHTFMESCQYCRATKNNFM